MDEDQLITIETKLAYQEKTIKELNDVVFEQQKAVEKLGSDYRKLVKRCDELSQMLSGNDAPANEKPPHY